MENHLFCFGLGYTATEIIKELSLTEPEKWKFSGTKRVANSYNHPLIEVFEFENITLLPKTITHILMSIPPKDDGDIAFNRFLEQIKRLPNLKWIGYFSTTGVYGDHQGNWVNEESELLTTNSRSLTRLKAEKQCLQLNAIAKVNIFRLPAIYGPSRSEIEKVLSGKAQIIIKPNQFFSRIHISDISQAVIKCMQYTTPNSIYNLSDDCPCPQSEVTGYAYKLLNLAPPKAVNFEEAELSEMAKSFYSESKKISNAKLKQELGITLRYPTYKEGLKAVSQAKL